MTEATVFGAGYNFEFFPPLSLDPRTSRFMGSTTMARFVGFYSLPGPSGQVLQRGFKRYSGGAFEFPMKVPGDGGATRPAGINENGNIYGSYRPATGPDKGFVRADGEYTTIDLEPTGNTDIANANNRGDLVGRTRVYWQSV